jgi:hypothetical protein
MAEPDLQPEADARLFNIIPTTPPHADPTTSPGVDPSTPSHATLSLPQSTPIKIESFTTYPFTTNQKYCVESCTMVGKEVKKYLIRLMPASQFLDDFFPVSELPGLDAVP